MTDKLIRRSARLKPVEGHAWARTLLDELERFEESRPQFMPAPSDLPEWVQNVLGECMKAIYPKQAFKPGQVTPAALGLFLGRHYALAMIFAGELPLGPKAERELEELHHQLKKQPVTAEQQQRADLIAQSMESYGPDSRALVAHAFAKALEQPALEALAFIQAFAKASRMKPDALANEYTMTHSLRLYFVLFQIWRVIEAGHFKSIAALHRTLRQKIPPHQAGNLKSFEKLCQKVGLKLRDPGRPGK